MYTQVYIVNLYNWKGRHNIVKKNIVRGIVEGVITFLLDCCITLALEYHYLEDKYQKIQSLVDDSFLTYMQDIDIEVGATAEDEEIFEKYMMAYKELEFAQDIYSLTSYHFEEINSQGLESQIVMMPVIMETKQYILDKAEKKEQIEPEMAKFIVESLKSIAENIDDAEKCNNYINELYEKLQ